MAVRKNTASRARIAAIDLSAILDDFTDARCVLECACRSLENSDASDEAVCVRIGLRMLQATYDKLDLAAIQVCRDA